MKTTNFSSPKHGAVIQITEKELQRLQKRWKFKLWASVSLREFMDCSLRGGVGREKCRNGGKTLLVVSWFFDTNKPLCKICASFLEKAHCSCKIMTTLPQDALGGTSFAACLWWRESSSAGHSHRNGTWCVGHACRCKLASNRLEHSENDGRRTHFVWFSNF